jgi:hypothetical protein
MRHGRFIATILAAAAMMAIGPAAASAATGSLADDSVADFNLGTPGSGAIVVNPGSVQLQRAPVTEPFEGSGLPGAGSALGSSFSGSQWDATGTWTVGGGALTVNGALVKQARTYLPGQIMDFTATFNGEARQHVGFATNLGPLEPYAIVSNDAGGSRIYARTYIAPGDEFETPLLDNASGPHSFRIEWSSTDVKYYVDGATMPAVTHPVAITTPMNPIVSDVDSLVGTGVSVDLLTMSLYTTAPGTFTSRVLDTREPTATWGSLTAMGATSGVSFRTRTGNSPTPDGTWSSFQPTVGDAIQSPLGRYIQYEATLTTADNSVTPTVDRVQIGYVDDAAPSAVIDGAQVTGTTARFAFSSAAIDLTGFECAIDGGAFTTCTSQKELTGLAPGSHTFAVRAVDAVGNAGSAASKSFTIDGPAAASSTGGAAAAASTTKADTTAPRVSVVVPSARVSKRGTIGVRVGCPATETRCRVTVVLKRGRATVAHKTVTVGGGKTVKVTLQLTQDTKRQLAKAHRLKVSALITARDAAGNQRSTTKQLTLRS